MALSEQERRDLRAVRVAVLIAGLMFAGAVGYPIQPGAARVAVIVVSGLALAFLAVVWRGLTAGRGPRNGA